MEFAFFSNWLKGNQDIAKFLMANKQETKQHHR
jgi:hypothetical protein